MLRRELWRHGLRYRLHYPALPGRPDLVLVKQRIAVFCDGDFWHGRDLEIRLAKLAHGIFCQLLKKPEALDAIRKAWEAGFKDAVWARRDPDLSLLHGDPEFERLAGR